VSVEITQGDTKPEIRVTITGDDGQPVNFDLAGAVRIRGIRNGAVVFDTADDVEASSLGTVVAAWPAGSTDLPGRITLQVVAEWTDGEQTFPIEDVVDVVPGPYSFVTVRELTDYMSDVAFNQAQENAAKAVLRGLTRNLERKLARGFTEGITTERAYAAEDGWVMLRRSPVKEIILVDALPAASYGAYPTFGGTGFRVTNGGCHGFAPLTWAEVTYRGGGGLDAEDLDDVRWAILEKAAQIMTNRHDDTVSVKDRDTREPTFRGEMRWTDDEVAQFDRLRRKVVL
jgi:hypothetical protein